MSITPDRIRVILATLLALLIGYAGARLVGFPADVGFDASLLRQPNAVLAIVGAIATLVVATVIALPIVRGVHAEAALAVGALALAQFTWRGGTIAQTLLEAGSKSIYLTLALETALLFGAAIGMWFVVRKFLPQQTEIPFNENIERALQEKNAESIQPEPLDQKLLATATQAIVMIACMLLLCRSTAKIQVFFSIFFSAMLGTIAAHRFISVRPGFWYWMGPVIVALVGYVTGYFSPIGLAVGDPGHYFAALARPLPLDYLAAAVPGAAWGYAIREAHREHAVLLVKQSLAAG